LSKIFITGSSDGLGQLAAKALIEQGHDVVIHARNEKRREFALKNLPGTKEALVADLNSIEETKQLAFNVNALGKFDAIIHNAGVYNATAKEIFTVNTLAPYILTFLIQKPQRLIYLTSGMHLHGNFSLEIFKHDLNGITYSDSKLHVMLLCKAVARRWPDVFANAVNPGWVPTKMGGQGAPDDLQKGYETQIWLATSEDEKVKVSGKYFFHKKEKQANPEADNAGFQETLLKACAEITGVSFSQ
jgi:NAD(P)-dependent dehydrogenase (short-subunit alcohol dehydrogenase family)